MLIQVTYEKWITTGERPCTQCAPLNGQEFKAGEGPQPPLHPLCQCLRVYSRTEYITPNQLQEQVFTPPHTISCRCIDGCHHQPYSSETSETSDTNTNDHPPIHR